MISVKVGNSNDVNLDVMSYCADRYGASLTAVILKWLQVTDQASILALSRDGFMLWESSSKSAMKAGAFVKTRSNTRGSRIRIIFRLYLGAYQQ